jgi:hypothetical protein
LNEAASSPNSLRSWGRWRPGLEWCAEASKKASTEYGRGAGAERKRVTELPVRWITPEGERARRDWSTATRSSAPAVRSRRGRNGSTRGGGGGGHAAELGEVGDDGRAPALVPTERVEEEARERGEPAGGGRGGEEDEAEWSGGVGGGARGGAGSCGGAAEVRKEAAADGGAVR